MNPADFSDETTLYCTLARMVYDRLRKSSDPATEKALNPYGLALPFSDRSAAVRNVWETVVKQALENMGIIGSGTAHDLHIHTKPAALELEESDSIF